MGKVFDIQRMSVHDGPGIRTTVFLKGCPLRCLWCHNPESQSFDVSIGFNAENCVGCGKCAKVCEKHICANGIHAFDRENCVGCGKCVEICPNDAMISSGYETTVEDVMREVLKDKTFYKNSGGGVTFSGGEPLAQPAFLLDLLQAAKGAMLHTAVDTSGFGSDDTIRKIAPFTDLFLFDWKESDEEKHLAFTGVSNRKILENLQLLDSLSARVILRCPIVPSLNDTQEHLQGIADLAAQYSCIEKVNIMAYHTLGDGKYTAFDMENPMTDKKIAAMEKAYAEKLAVKIREMIDAKTQRTIPVEV